MAKRKTIHADHSLLIVLFLALIALLFVLLFYTLPKNTINPPIVTPHLQSFNFSNQTIMINGQKLTFVNGVYKSADQQETATIINSSTNPVRNRAAAIVVDNPGGSGTFYYIYGAMSKAGRETYSQPVQLGDRIKIESVTVDDPQAEDNGMITVKYLDHTADEAMADAPTQEVTAQFAFQDDGNLLAVLH